MHNERACGEGTVYQIKVQGTIDQSWSEWFGGMMISSETVSDGSSITTLTGPVADQSVLRGLLAKVWDLNLTLVSVIRTDAIGETQE